MMIGKDLLLSQRLACPCYMLKYEYKWLTQHLVSSNEKEAMDLLAKESIAGAEFDPSERDPPPSCHPGTRLEKIQTWAHGPACNASMLWLNGPAGVGKSAIMQTISELEASSPNSILGAIFFFLKVNRRNDPRRVFVTPAYQLTIKYPPYHQHVVDLLTQNPKILQKSMAEQFKQLFVLPFVGQELFGGLHNTALIDLDGLDECDGEWGQREIISLIGQMISQHPTSPLIWLFASRPEPHIRLSMNRLGSSKYLEFVVPIDSDKGCKDVECYLQDKFQEIRENYPSSFPSSMQFWPAEIHFSKISKSANGMFIFASTIIGFVGGSKYANPISQLRKVLDVIESTPISGTNPFAVLDVLYTAILVEIPHEILPQTQSILTDLHSDIGITNPTSSSSRPVFANSCNYWGLRQADAHSALHKLHSVLKISELEEADRVLVIPYHKSFLDYLETPS
ncbi:hypothetical protein AN958_07215 [Leucoagaricus sp. SymC.cos]|nr:hypothetical protein AN958_07215 [Leucoagaricus sp. SymC.cos]